MHKMWKKSECKNRKLGVFIPNNANAGCEIAKMSK